MRRTQAATPDRRRRHGPRLFHYSLQYVGPRVTSINIAGRPPKALLLKNVNLFFREARASPAGPNTTHRPLYSPLHPGFTRSCLGGLCSLVWAGSPSPLRVSAQCSASWPDGSTRLGLEPTVTTTTTCTQAVLRWLSSWSLAMHAELVRLW
jgi:hypothetical protein